MPSDPSGDDAKALVRRFGCCERGWIRVWNVDVNWGKLTQGASGGKRARQVHLREGKEEEPYEALFFLFFAAERLIDWCRPHAAAPPEIHK